jgi:DNA-binding MarR family transcriptional regulator
MIQKEIITELIEEIYNFDAEFQGEKNFTMADFAGYLNSKMVDGNTSIRKIGGEVQSPILVNSNNPTTDITILLVLMYRYAKSYVKKALAGKIIQTADEFSFLITLLTFESLTKTELINKQIIEKTSGTEIIKRLLNLELITEFADPDDKRSVRVAITPKGKQEIATLLPEMGVVSHIVTGNLTDNEISTLSYMLKKLDFYHNDIFMNKRHYSLDELVVKQ